METIANGFADGPTVSHSLNAYNSHISIGVFIRPRKPKLQTFLFALTAGFLLDHLGGVFVFASSKPTRRLIRLLRKTIKFALRTTHGAKLIVAEFRKGARHYAHLNTKTHVNIQTLCKVVQSQRARIQCEQSHLPTRCQRFFPSPVHYSIICFFDSFEPASVDACT